MKNVFRIALAALACVLCLAACGKQECLASWTTANAQAVLDSGAFSETLEELDCSTAWMLYRLDDAGLERECLTDGVVFRSAGATCEELAVLIFDHESDADAAMEAMENYVQSQIESNRDYRPAEIPKLEGKWLEQRGNTLLLAVASDMDAAKASVG